MTNLNDEYRTRTTREPPASLGWPVISVVAMCAVVALLDGFDTLAISYVAPVIADAWRVPKETFGPIFSAHYVGAAIGAAAFGMLADRYGRRPIILVSTFVFGVCALMTSLAYDLPSLLILRALTGLGLGGALSNVIAMVSEYAPARLRATLVSLMYAAFPLGGVLGGPMSAAVIAVYGWQGVFLIGGVAPLILAAVLAAALPESPRFMLMHGPGDPRRSAGATLPLAQTAQSSFRQLFAGEYRRVTVLLSFAAFLTQLVIVFVITWMPTLLTSAGLPLSRSILVSATFSLGGIVGSLLLARLIDRQQSFRSLIATFVASSVAIGSIGFSTFNAGWLMATVGVAGLLIVGAQVNLSAYTAIVYPTRIRSTGIGWVVGIGRIGAIAGALAGTALVAAGLDLGQQYLIAGIPALLAALAVALTRARDQDFAEESEREPAR